MPKRRKTRRLGSFPSPPAIQTVLVEGGVVVVGDWRSVVVQLVVVLPLLLLLLFIKKPVSMKKMDSMKKKNIPRAQETSTTPWALIRVPRCLCICSPSSYTPRSRRPGWLVGVGLVMVVLVVVVVAVWWSLSSLMLIVIVVRHVIIIWNGYVV